MMLYWSTGRMRTTKGGFLWPLGGSEDKYSVINTIMARGID